ncbi:MAG: hypothetical protein R3285_06410 [Kiloniellales bacterium]|nr:hypothetical protein [Kiloniellales bacterium]
MDERHRVVRECLLRLAAERRTATYHELAALAAIPPPQRIHRLTLLLEDLIRDDHAAGRPLLAACAVGRAQNGIPGRGFFQLLRDLGRYGGSDRGAEAVACHGAELEAAWEYWGAYRGGTGSGRTGPSEGR